MSGQYKNKAFTLRINDSLMSELRTIAENENRPVTKQIEYILAQYLKERREQVATAQR